MQHIYNAELRTAYTHIYGDKLTKKNRAGTDDTKWTPVNFPVKSPIKEKLTKIIIKIILIIRLMP